MKIKVVDDSMEYRSENEDQERLARRFQFIFQQMCYDLADYLLTGDSCEPGTLAYIKKNGCNVLIRVRLGEVGELLDGPIEKSFEDKNSSLIDLVMPMEIRPEIFQDVIKLKYKD